MRVERDLLGEREVPAAAYWGIHTLRARENFPITGTPIGSKPFLIEALASVKEASAAANGELGHLDGDRVRAITAACEEIRGGMLRDQFVVDVIQGGAGTSTNMNANEVIANRGLEHLGHERGEYSFLHPNEHVNRSQSTNDVYATAVRIALARGALRLAEATEVLRAAFVAKADEFADVIKLGRTQLQDAVPMTLGQEFAGYAVMLGEDRERLLEAVALLHEINLGGTAIGTGLAAPPGYAEAAAERLAALTELPLRPAPDLVEATQDAGAYVQVSGALKRLAVKLSKVCNDLRLLSSGPRAGLGEIVLPAVQVGSSLMPGKVNPVIPEVVNAIAFEVVGHDATVTMAAEAGQLQLNPFVPLIHQAISESCEHLAAGCGTLAQRCVGGIVANRQKLVENALGSTAVLTALIPEIGYRAGVELAAAAAAEGRDVRDLAVARGLLSEARLEEVLAGVFGGPASGAVAGEDKER
ncbi:MAG: aspartate ammonia-lyase [Actinobacteria bacterium]|nr:aspartate ammonia-lyase [Actinomycetota bacterium]